MTAAFFAGDTKKAMDMQLGYLDLIHALFSEVNPIPVKKAMNMMGMEVGPLRMPLTEMEEAHAKVLADEMKKAGIEVKQREGYGLGNWVLLDFGEIIVHVFDKENRLFYDLERIWRDGKTVDVKTL